MSPTDMLRAIAVREDDALADDNLLAEGPMEWNSTPAYPSTLVLVLTGIGAMLLVVVAIGLADAARTWRRGRGRR